MLGPSRRPRVVGTTADKPTVSPEDLERLATFAVALVPDSTAVGLGSGRAATAFVRALGARVRGGLRVHGVPTSQATAALAREVGIPLIDLDRTPLELTVDGADEVDPDLNLIKGYGGALVRERIVAAASRRQVILVTPDKLVPRLGSRGRLPVEIVVFARRLCEARLEALGCRPELRGGEARPFLSDNGNWILDCTVAPLDDPAGLEREIRRIPGVVDTGLFLGTAETVALAEGGAVRTLRPRTATR
ncbi:MAG: ribose-5-phosphate isomerase RpiA [Candidatus Rokubacteria bacterium]|nr:ribose-5-phosphate isomerase RpiA [Candidatus Rokubacteria bacterium]